MSYITGENVTLFVGVVGLMATAWWRLDTMMKAAAGAAQAEAKAAAAKAEAAASMALHAQSMLAEYKTHVAEHYITKAGLRETSETILAGMAGIERRLDTMNERMDQIIMYEKRTSGRASRATR